MTKILYIPTGQFLIFSRSHIEDTILFELSVVGRSYDNFFDFLKMSSRFWKDRNNITIENIECFEVIDE